MGGTDGVARARQMIREEAEGLEHSLQDHRGDSPLKLHDVHYMQGKIDAHRQDAELLDEVAPW